MTTGEKIAAQARQYIGVPFQHCGRNEHGMDCVGLCLKVGYDLELTSYEPANYGRHVDAEFLRSELRKVLTEVPLQELEPGCIVLTRCTREQYPFHVGIYTGSTFIHAFQTRGCVVEVTWGDYWIERTEAVFTWRQ